MVLLVIAAIVAYFIFSKSSTPPSNSLSNAGGTSTPQPTKITPPFYQQSNSATGSRPVTQSSVDDTGSIPSKLNTVQPFVYVISNPIPEEHIASLEPTSVGQEQAMVYSNNGVGDSSIPTENAINAPLGVSALVPRVTNNSPSSVPHNNIALYHEQAASIAPNPPVNVKLETIIPKIASTLKTPSKVIPPTLQRQTILREATAKEL